MDEARFAILKAEIDDCCREIDYVYERIDQRMGHFEGSAESTDSLAYQLHNLYGTFERLFEVVASAFENHVEGERYHTDLLRRMRLEIEGIRPALIAREGFHLLDDLRRFRHFFRHAYSAELNVDQIQALLTATDRLRSLYKNDVGTFLERLKP